MVDSVPVTSSVMLTEEEKLLMTKTAVSSNPATSGRNPAMSPPMAALTGFGKPPVLKLPSYPRSAAR